MNNLSNLNLDVTKYSNLELKEIFGLSGVMNADLIEKHISQIETSILNDMKLPFDSRNKIVIFLNSAKHKLKDDTINMHPPAKVDLTYGSQTSYIVPNTPLSNPLIHNPNTLASLKANINEGIGGHYPAGYLNPINIKTIKRTINIDSKFRKSYYNAKSSDFHLDLPETFKKVVNMKLTSFEIPISIHSINNCNNCFVVKEIGTTDIKTIDISNGNYTTQFTSAALRFTEGDAFKENLDNALSNKSVDLSYNINPINGFSEFELTPNGIAANRQYELLFNTDCSGNPDLETPLPFKLGWNLGYRLGSYTVEKDHKAISEGIINLDFPRYIYISINDFTHAAHQTGFIATFSDSTLVENIISRVEYRHYLQNEGKYNTACDPDATETFNRMYYGPVDIQKLHIKVLDEYGRIVDFNNMDWSFTLVLEMLYD
tara:strand:- start:3387 stop:4676 length:1290 start_codon:yes stop_codon:yes gene_type:complete